MPQQRYGFVGLGDSSGNEWVKTASGWRKLIALRENLHRHIKKIARERFQNSCKDSSSGEGTSSDTNQQGTNWAPGQTCDAVTPPAAPHQEDKVDISQAVRHEYQIRDKPQATYVLIPRAVGARANYLTIGEVMCKLDLASAVRDHRRFNYVCKLLELIVTTRFSSLSGLAQKNLMDVLEEALDVVIQTQQNMAQLRGILHEAIVAMNNSRITHIGCQATWKNRMTLLQCWLEKLNSIRVKEREDDGALVLTELPDEVTRRILYHLSDARDIMNVEKTCFQLHLVATSNMLWRDHCKFHFTEREMEKVCKTNDPATNWKGVYKKLHKRHPLNQVYADMLQICGFCNCLFWMNGGHPCSKELLPEGDPKTLRPELMVNDPITPRQFLMRF